MMAMINQDSGTHSVHSPKCRLLNYRQMLLLGISSSCDSWAEQDIDEVESKNSKRTCKKKGSKKSKTKGKEQNFVKRNIEVRSG